MQALGGQTDKKPMQTNAGSWRILGPPRPPKVQCAARLAHEFGVQLFACDDLQQLAFMISVGMDPGAWLTLLRENQGVNQLKK